MAKDYYQILGVEKGASKDDIKKAFRKAAHEHHPDKGGDEARFKEINEAYQILGDEEKRKQYDQFGTTFDGAGGQGFGGFNGFSQNVNFEDLSDLFGGMFGGMGGGRGNARGSDIQVDVRLSFQESVFGVEKEIPVSKNSSCDRCAGTGSEPGTAMKTCGDCSGKGMKIGVQRTMFGNVQTRVTCETCSGAGEVPETKCSSCQGIGIEYGRKTLSISIPAGIEDGMRIRVRGEGESIGNAGDAGDLFIRVHVKGDDRFERDGLTIYSKREIGFTQAALGADVEVETVDGPVTLKVPSGTQSGDKLRLKGKGVASARGRGDHIVIMHVKTPKKLNRKQKQLLEQLDLKE